MIFHEFLSLQLRKCDPKPNDPVQFIRKRLAEPTIDVEEFHCMKQSLIQMNHDMGQLRADITKIANIVSKLVPAHVRAAEMESSPNDSMVNNVGDESHISMLDESSLIFDETMNQTVINSAELDTTMNTVSTPPDTPNVSQDAKANGCPDGFTMEIVEVDVVQQSQNSQDFLSATQEEKIANGMEVDSGSSSVAAMTSTPNSSLTEQQMTNNSNRNGVASEFTVPVESATDAESMQIDSTDMSATLSAHSLDSILNTTENESDESKMDIKIEDLPIVLKGNDSEEKL